MAARSRRGQWYKIMATLQDTNLIIQAAQLPATFVGTPQEFLDAIIRRMKIVSPSGTNFIFVGDTEPTSDVGPWLKNGTQWWVYDLNIKRYVPLDITASEKHWFHVGATTPTDSDPPVWLRTTKDQTDNDPSIGNPVGWYVFNGTVWVPYVGIVPSGPTSSRPSNPVDFTQFYDTDISALIWFERAAWRTVSGVPGDVKMVAFEVLEEALAANPGWEVLGKSNQDFRGRVLSQATKDSGGSPATDLNVGAGITKRGAFELWETEHVSAAGVTTGYMGLWTLVKT